MAYTQGLIPHAELEKLYGLGEQIKLAIIAGNIEQAKHLVDRGPAVLAPEPEYDVRDPASAPLAVVIRDEKLHNYVFDQLAVATAGEFVALHPTALYALSGVGRKTGEKLEALQHEWRAKLAAARR
jgi:hypothetical protein